MDDFGTLAAVVYQAGFRVDDFLADVARRLRDEGLRIGGVVQENAGAANACAAMTLVDLRSSGRFHISQNLGGDARGCRLDPRGLAEAESPLASMVDADPDIVLLNKFGKAESQGGGLRSTFVRAIEREIPVLTAVRAPYIEHWQRFHGGLAVALAPNADAVLVWCRAAARCRIPAARRAMPARVSAPQ